MERDELKEALRIIYAGEARGEKSYGCIGAQEAILEHDQAQRATIAGLDQVVGEAVKFAELYTNAGVRKRFLCFNEHYHEAMCFLTSPQVQAWRKGKEGKG